MPQPLREPTFLILAALAGGPLHGYGLIAEVDRLSDGHVTADREEIVDGRLRRYYRLTPDGETALRAETERMRRHVQAVAARLHGLGTTAMIGRVPA